MQRLPIPAPVPRFVILRRRQPYRPFPVLGAGAELVVHSRPGSDADDTLYWGADDGVWAADGGELTVADETGDTRLEVTFDERGVIYYDEPPTGPDDSPVGLAELGAGLAGLGAASLGSLYLAYRRLSGDED